MARTTATEKSNMANLADFAYSVGKDISKIDQEVKLLKARGNTTTGATIHPEIITQSGGVEVLSFEVPKLFEQDVLSKLNERGENKEILVEVELPESFKNSVCLTNTGKYDGWQVVDIKESLTLPTKETAYRAYFIKLTNQSEMKTSVVDPVIDENYAQAQKIVEMKKKGKIFIKWLAKYITETYLAKLKEQNEYYAARNDYPDLEEFVERPLYHTYQGYYVSIYDSEMNNDLYDKKSKLESGEIDPETAKDFVIPEYPQV